MAPLSHAIAAERLADRGETVTLRDRHLQWLAELTDDDVEALQGVLDATGARAEIEDSIGRLTGEAVAAVEQALSLGVSDAAAVHHILAIPDAEERRRHQIALAAELAEFERPLPVMDDYDLLLSEGAGGVQ